VLHRALSLSGESISVLIHSPKLRAVQTAEILSSNAIGDKVLEDERLLPSGEVSQVEQLLEQHSDTNVALVSHLPLVAHLAAWFSAGQIDAGQFGYFAPAGLVELEMDTVGRGCAELLSLDFASD
jgi:phosphohistidine phosphatase SixA